MTAVRVLLMSSLACVAVGQGVRDLRPEPTGSCVLAGVVATDDAPGRPLGRATVQLSGDALLAPRIIVTDGDGRYAFKGLPAGQYSLQVRRSGYMPTNYGAKRPNGPGQSLVVADGEGLDGLAFRLTRWAVITGTVYDQNGEPLEGASIEVLAYSLRTGIRTLSSVYGRAQTTDDRGVYRYAGLDPGDYLVAAGPSAAAGALEALSAADVNRAWQSASAIGSIGRPAGPALAAPSYAAFAPVFYPGTFDLSNATTISVKAGEERGGVDIHLQLVRTVAIDGTVTMPDGQPAANITISMQVVDVPYSVDLFRVGDPGTEHTDVQGRFHYASVPPGRYDVRAVRMRMTPAAQRPMSSDLLWARTTLAVSGADQEVSLSLQPGFTITGRLVLDGTTLKPPDLTALSVQLPMPGYGQAIGAQSAKINADGTFQVEGVSPGLYRMTVAIAGATPTSGWVPRSSMVDGVDALDAPVLLSQNTEGVVVTLTNHPAGLSGALQAPEGVHPSDYFIIVFSTDQAQWSPQSRRTLMARPTNVGRYSIRYLPPGEYYLAAVTDVLQNEWFDPKFLEPLVPAAIRVTIKEGEQKTQDIRIGRVGPLAPVR